MTRFQALTRRAVVLLAVAFIPATAALAAGSATAGFQPSAYTPGSPVTLFIQVSPDTGTAAYAVQDAPPTGWTVSSISESGTFDGANRLVKWGPFFDDNPRTLTYTTTPPAGTSGPQTFSGTASFDGSGVPIGGDRTISIEGGGAPPPPPSGRWLSSSSLPGFEVQGRISPAGVPPSDASLVSRCIPETLCLGGAVPGRSELFVRMVGPKPNGFLWPNVLKFSTSPFEIWIRQVRTGQIQYYQLPGVVPGDRLIDLTGLADKEGFRP